MVHQSNRKSIIHQGKWKNGSKMKSPQRGWGNTLATYLSNQFNTEFVNNGQEDGTPLKEGGGC